MIKRRIHHSFVSYIDKSRNYYAAQGYEEPYGWAHQDRVPFRALSKPLAECRVGVATTADRGPRVDGRHVRLYAAPIEKAQSLHTEMSWDREATHTEDPETYVPLAAISRHVADRRIGSASTRFYGVATEYSQRRTLEEDAPQIERWMREDGLDVCVMVAI